MKGAKMKHEKLESSIIEHALKTAGRNVTWLASEKGLHFSTFSRKIRVGKWTVTEIDSLVRILGNEIIQKARSDNE